jgi:hypothetical protein
MAAAAPSVEDMFQQLMNSIQDLSNRSIDTNARFDELLKRVTDIEVAQSLAVYPTSAPQAVLNPLLLNTKRSTERSKSSSPTNSEADDKESSIANPGNQEDLAAVLDAAADTPILAKRRSASDPKDRRDSYFIRQLTADDNDTTIKYHTKAPEQPEPLKRCASTSGSFTRLRAQIPNQVTIGANHQPILHGSSPEPIQHQPQAVP